MSLPRVAWRPLAFLLVVTAVILTAVSGRYGFHRDELYFVVAGRHPAAGYVDQPPLTPLLARVGTTAFGTTPAGLRIVATLTTMASVLVVALIARELGGGRQPQVLAGVCTAASAYVAVVGHMVSTATFDLLGCLAVSWLVLRVLRTRDGRWWLAVGAVAGVALLNKDLVLVLLAAVAVGILAVGILAVGPRAALRTWWLPAGFVVALVVPSPNLVWQAMHGWPQLTVAAGISADDGVDNRVQFVPQQLVYLSPLFVPVWIAGLVRLWRDYAVRWARSFGLAYPVAAAVVLVVGGKAYYVIPLLLVLLAAGVEPALCWFRRGRSRTRHVLGIVGLTLAAVVSAFIALPLLPPRLLGPSGVLAVNKESGEQVGWPRFTAAVARGWREIPPGQRPTAVIITGNYGEAGAIALYGPRFDLPRPYSGHMSFAEWGRRRRPPRVPSSSCDRPATGYRPAGSRVVASSRATTTARAWTTRNRAHSCPCAHTRRAPGRPSGPASVTTTDGAPSGRDPEALRNATDLLLASLHPPPRKPRDVLALAHSLRLVPRRLPSLLDGVRHLSGQQERHRPPEHRPGQYQQRYAERQQEDGDAQHGAEQPHDGSEQPEHNAAESSDDSHRAPRWMQ